MSLKAYKATQAATEDPRATEYRLFGQVTGALINAKQSNAVGGPLVEAVDWNRRCGARLRPTAWTTATSSPRTCAPRSSRCRCGSRNIPAA